MEEQIKATITSAYGHVKDAYDKLKKLGATMPAEKNIENLKPTIYTLPLEIDKVVVTFDDGVNVPTTAELFPGQTVAKPADPVKDGCTFLGWFTEGPSYDPDNPTLEGLKTALDAGDYTAFPTGTEIPDTYDGHSNPLIVAQYLDSSNNSEYSGAEGVILVRKWVEPISQRFGNSNEYSISKVKEFLDTTYYDKCSDALKKVIADIGIQYYNGSSKTTVTSKLFLMSAYEVCSQGNDGVTEYEGVMWDYWKQKTGLSAPDEMYTDNKGRIMKDRSGTAQYVWLRSCWNSNAVCLVYPNGSVYGGNVFYSYGVLPACFMAKN